MEELHVRLENVCRVVERWDHVFTALSSEPRRQLVVSLLDAPPGEPVPLPESAQNPDIPADPDRLRQQLYHQHLPLLADHGFVEWDVEPLVASRGPDFQEVAAVIEALYENANELPDTLVTGCQRLEREQQHRPVD